MTINRRIVICRPLAKAQELVMNLSLNGIESYSEPLISISIGRDIDLIETELLSLTADSLVFLLSPNIFYYSNALPRLEALRITRAFKDCLGNYFAIGQSTASKFLQLTQKNAYYPDGREISENLIKLPILETVIKECNNLKKQALIIRGNSGRNIISDYLTKRGLVVKELESYSRIPINFNQTNIEEHVTFGGICLFIVTSGEILSLLTKGILKMIGGAEYIKTHEIMVVSERLVNLAIQSGWKNIFLSTNANNEDITNTIIEIVKDGTN
ncbi:uroporphyrinogen-III synthase [Thorsellia anophelis]|uniref:Uroporphyrinogen-III synthase n=1 Tax=Thorsellia anophelis DSM 18579 TaxID=1123402 RepID=A0A1H9ZNN5_9GAMM|nr:uroporphyrinogen-III synthase [Thorsellia anophelis]SES83253.1 uroporphyrinogen-III synthase [Thorsellia anophelis DSM 18579]